MSEWRDELDELSFFRLGPAYHYGVEIQREIEERIERIVIFPHDAGILAQVVHNARHSNHVEIGTFYGGTAILAALTKEHFKMHGKIFCVDPLECRPKRVVDQVTNDVASTSTIMANARKFGVEDRIVLVPRFSYPWPLEGETFGTGYIDGDHWNGMPLRDWDALRKCVSYAVVFDDYVKDKSEVIRAIHVAMQDPQWILIHMSGSHVVFRRRQ